MKPPCSGCNNNKNNADGDPLDNDMHPQRVILKNEGSRVQTYRNMNVHAVNTYMLRHT